ncbi:MAG: hypothetical protein ABSF22_16355 [Bryobacteraceae bacterium]
MLKITRLSLAAVIAAFLGSALPANASSFVFEAGSSISLIDPLMSDATQISYGISGTFTYSGDVASNVDVTLTGAGPFAGLYTTTDSSPHFVANQGATLILPFTSPWDLDFTFVSSLSTSPDALSFVYLINQSNGAGSGNVVGVEASGGAIFASTVPPSSTPEPAAIWLTAAGCAIFGLLRRIMRAERFVA